MELACKYLAGTLRDWRKKNGVKVETAARDLGVATATWGHWEAGRRLPAAKNLTYLSQYLKLPICHLFHCLTDGDCDDCEEKNGAKHTQPNLARK